MTTEGKRLLREAREQKGFTFQVLAEKLGCSITAVQQLLGDGTRGSIRPTRSSVHLPRLCQLLEVPLWAVQSGPTEQEVSVLAALELVRGHAPARYEKFVQEISERAHDMARAAGWLPGSESDDDDDDRPRPPAPQRSRLLTASR